MFRPFVSCLFKIKSEHKDIPYAKSILNILWGALSQRKITRNVIIPTSEFVIDYEQDIVSIKNCHNGKLEIKSVHRDSQFETDYARFAPFITSRGRELITNIIDKDASRDIVRCVTDGFITKTKLAIKSGSGLGDLRYEGRCDNIKINHLYSVEGNFII